MDPAESGSPTTGWAHRQRPSNKCSAAATWKCTELRPIPLIRRSGLVIGAILAAHSAAIAEVRMEEREGVLYVKNVEPPQPQPAVASQPSSPPGKPVAAKTAAPYRGLIRAAAAKHGPAPDLVEAVSRVAANLEPRAVPSTGR